MGVLGKDEVFDKTARQIMSSDNNADMEAFLLSYPMVLTPKNDLALLWVEEYHKACSWRLDSDKHKKNQEKRLLEFMRIWAKNYPNDFTPASRKAILDALGKENIAPAILNEFKLLFLKRKCLMPSTPSIANGATVTGSNGALITSSEHTSGPLGSRGSGIRTSQSGSLTAREYSPSSAGIRPSSNSPSGSLTARERLSRTTDGGAADLTASTSTSSSATLSLTSSSSSENTSKPGIQPSLSGGSLDKFLTSRPSGKKKRSATIDGCQLPDLVSELMISERAKRAPSSSTTSLTSSQSSTQTSPPLSPRSERRRLSKDSTHSLSTNNVRSVMSVPTINLNEIRKKDQINLKEKDQKVIKKIRSASLNKNEPSAAASLISPRIDTGRLKEIVRDIKKKKKFLDFSTATLAREMTMQEWDIFKKIQPREFLNQAWQRENKHIIAPNIIRMIERFNQISFWVATEILTKDRKTQVKVIKKFIKTAYICFHLGNFNSMMEILSGLNNISVSRLKDTWRQVPEKYKAYFEELELVMDNQQNFARYRDLLAKREVAKEPTLPYFGLFLRYFTYLDDGNPAYYPDKSINITAMELRLEHVQKVMKYQSIPYSLSRSVTVQNYLNNLTVVEDEDLLYAMSLASQAPAGGQMETLAIDPEAQMLAEGIASLGRPSNGFSHNQPFLPSEYTDDTSRDDTTEETSSSFLESTDAMTLERDEDVTDSSMMESDLDEDEERLEERVAKLRQQILDARTQKHTLDQRRPKVVGGNAAERSRILREMGHATRRVTVLRTSTSSLPQKQLLSKDRRSEAQRKKHSSDDEGRISKRKTPTRTSRSDDDSSDESEEDESPSQEVEGRPKQLAARRHNRDLNDDDDSESSDDEDNETATSADGESSGEESDSEESDSSEDEESSEEEEDDDEDDSEEESSEEDESNSGSVRGTRRGPKPTTRPSSTTSASSAPSSSTSSSSACDITPPRRRTIITIVPSTKQARSSQRGVYIPPLYFSAAEQQQADGGHHHRKQQQQQQHAMMVGRERERDPYTQYISPRVHNLPYSPRKRASIFAHPPPAAPSAHHGAGAPPPMAVPVVSMRSGGSGIRRKSTHSRSNSDAEASGGSASGGAHAREEQSSGEDGAHQQDTMSSSPASSSSPTSLSKRDQQLLERTSSFRFFAHLSEGVPEVMKSIKQPSNATTHRSTPGPMHSSASQALTPPKSRRRPSSLSRSDVSGRRKET